MAEGSLEMALACSAVRLSGRCPAVVHCPAPSPTQAWHHPAWTPDSGGVVYRISADGLTLQWVNDEIGPCSMQVMAISDSRFGGAAIAIDAIMQRQRAQSRAPMHNARMPQPLQAFDLPADGTHPRNGRVPV